jgi:Protein of unknown function with HXXEE motif
LQTNVSRRAWYLSVALAFAIHNAEEATAAPRLLNFMQSIGPMAFRAFYEGITASELRASLVVLTLLGIIITAFAVRSPHRPPRAYAMLVFAAVIALNALAHVALSGIYRAYMPGLVTALLVTMPVGVMIFFRARRDAWVVHSVLDGAPHGCRDARASFGPRHPSDHCGIWSAK